MPHGLFAHCLQGSSMFTWWNKIPLKMVLAAPAMESCKGGGKRLGRLGFWEDKATGELYLEELAAFRAWFSKAMVPWL